MSDEPNKPNGQEQPEDSPTSHQFSEPSGVAAEPGDLDQPSNTPSKSTDATDHKVLEQEQRCPEVDSQVGDPVPQLTAENANGQERSDIPPARPEEQAQAQGISASVTPAEEQPKDHPKRQIDTDSHLDEADQPSPQANAETTNELEQSDTPPAGQDEQTNGTSGSAICSEEPLGDDAESPIGSDCDLTETDRGALLSYEKRLGRGNVRDPGFDEVEFQTSPTHDLVRWGERICIGVVRWLGPNSTLTRYVSGASKNGQPIDVPDMPLAVYETMLLPTDVVSYCSARKVFDKIFALLQHVPMLSGKQRELLTYWCMAGWFSDVLPSIPRLTITGPQYAADLLFRVLRCVCRRPVLLAGISPAVLKSMPISKLMPTLFIAEPNPSKRASALLHASDQKGYIVANGGQMQQCYCVKCVYTGEAPPKPAPEGIHIHLARHASLPGEPLPSDGTVQTLQNQLLSYRCFNLDRVRASEFKANGLLPELDVVARPLGAAIVNDFVLQVRVVELLEELNEQARVDRSSGLQGAVVRAVLFHCHESDQQKVFVRDIAAEVNRICGEEGESLKVSSERVGHVLKDLCLYSRRLGSRGKGLVLDKSTQLRAHELSYAYEVLPDVPACGYCHQVQLQESNEVV